MKVGRACISGVGPSDPKGGDMAQILPLCKTLPRYEVFFSKKKKLAPRSQLAALLPLFSLTLRQIDSRSDRKTRRGNVVYGTHIVSLDLICAAAELVSGNFASPPRSHFW